MVREDNREQCFFLSSLSAPVPVFWLVEVKLIKEVESWN